jgi:hypothetical protein
MSAPEPTPPAILTPASAFPDPIPGIIPFGTVTLFAGAPGVGKTAMLAEWCRRWRDGKTICGHPTNRPTGFYYLAADRQWKSHQVWFDAVGFPDIPHYSLADDTTLDLSTITRSFEAHSALQTAIDKLNPKPGGHLHIDPVSPLFIGGDPNRARDVAASLLRISRICQQRRINITLTAHFGKQKGDPREQYTRPQDRIAGSGAFAGFSDTQIYLIDPMPPAQPYHVLGWVPRHAKQEEFHFIRREEDGLFVNYELYTELDKHEKAVVCIPFDPTPASIVLHKLQTALNVSLKSAERYLAQLVKDGRVLKLRRGTYQRAA